MGMKDEVKKMFNALSGRSDGPETDAPTTDEPSAPETDPPAPETDEPKTEAPTTDEPKTEPPATDPPEDEAERIKRENEELRKKIAELSEPKTEPPKTEAPTTDPPIEDLDFLGDLDPDDISRDPREFNRVMNSIYKKAVETVRKEMKHTSSQTMRSIPDIVKTNIAVQENLRKLSEKFYEDNEDLKPFNKVVATVFEETVKEHPDKTFTEILDTVGKVTRDRLELKKPSSNPDGPPPLPRKTGGKVKSQQPRPDKVASDISEMNKSLNR